MSVLERFEQTAILLPDTLALRDKKRSLTFQQLNERANKVAYALRQLGVREECVVGLYLNRTVDLITGLLAIWKAAAAFLPLDPELPLPRLSFMLEDSEARYLLTERSLHTSLPQYKGKILYIEDVFENGLIHTERFSIGEVPSDRLAYVIYTSGSTGKPKGVAVCHGGIENNAIQAAEHFELSPDDIVLATITVAFDMSYLELYPALIRGACLYIVERSCVRDAACLLKVMETSGATVMMGTPTLWNLLLESGWKGNPKLKIVTAGEALPLMLGRTLAGMTRLVWNHYGPTEASISVSAAKITADVDRITIGTPLKNIQIHILDGSLSPVCKGEVGELYLGGACVARGYINREELNTASFLPDPFSKIPGARMYKSGDLGRELPDGRIEYLGRKDEQVKIRGYRVELSEIEEVLRQYEGVQAVSVQLVEVSPGDQRLVAFLQREKVVNTRAIRTFLERILPAYMVPSEYFTIGALPMTENGKVDRKALNAIRLEQTDRGKSAIEPPKDDLESVLKQCWEKVLKVKPISIKDNFFELGGHSFLASRLFTEIHRKTGKSIPLSLLLEFPTIELLARYIRQQRSDRGWPGVVKIQNNGSRAPLFIVYGLAGNLLLFHELTRRFGPEQPIYGLQMAPGEAGAKTAISISELASMYIRHMTRVTPTGPYHLVGHSVGALIAYEMARQLTRRGEEVGLLALLDWDLDSSLTPSFKLKGSNSLSSATFKELLNTNIKYLGSLLSRAFSKRRNELIYRKYFYLKMRLQLWLLIRFSGIASKVPSFFEEDAYIALATRKYQPQPYSGDVVVLMASEGLLSRQGGNSGWSRVVRGTCEFIEVPGTHHTMLMPPHVDVLARELTQRLATCDQQQSENSYSTLTGS